VLFGALAVALCRDLPVARAAAMLRRCDKPLWRRITVHVDRALALDDRRTVEIVGIDETRWHRGQRHLTVVHDLATKRLLVATEVRDHQTVIDFAAALPSHGADPSPAHPVCQGMSPAFAKGVGRALPNAQISFDRFQVAAMAMDAVAKVQQATMRDEPKAVTHALGTTERKTLEGLLWGLRKNSGGGSRAQTDAMHWPQRSTPKSARACRLKTAPGEVCARAAANFRAIASLRMSKPQPKPLSTHPFAPVPAQ
jgi:transposase